VEQAPTITRPYEKHGDILARIDRTRREWRTINIFEGVLLFLTVWLGVWLCFLAGEIWIRFPPFMRQAMLILLGVAFAAGFVWFVLRRVLQDRTPEEIAILVESAYPETDNALINAVRLGKDETVSSWSLVNAAIQESADRTADLAFYRAVDRRRFRRYGVATGALVVALTVLLLLFPHRVQNAFARIVRPRADIRRIGSVRLKQVLPGDCTLASGDTLAVSAVIEPEETRDIDAILIYQANPRVTVSTDCTSPDPKYIADRITAPIVKAVKGVRGVKGVRPGPGLISGTSIVEIEFHPGTDVAAAARRVENSVAAIRRHLPRDAADPRIAKSGGKKTQRMRMVSDEEFKAQVRDVKADLRYRVRVADTESDWYAVTVVERPVVIGISLDYKYPAYTRLPERRVEQSDGNISAIVGTVVDIAIRSNNRIKKGQLKIDADDHPLHVQASRRVLTTSLSLAKDSTYTIHIMDELEHYNREPIVRSIQATPDEKPRAEIPQPGKDRTLTAGDTLQLTIRGSDDFGMALVELISRKEGEEEEKTIKQWTDFADRKQVSLAFDWVFDKTLYKNGQVIRYFARITDNNNISGPGVGRSAEYRVRLEDLAAKKEEATKKYSDWQMRLEEVLKQQKELREKTRLLEQ